MGTGEVVPPPATPDLLVGLGILVSVMAAIAFTIWFLAWGIGQRGFAYYLSPRWKPYRVRADVLASLPDAVWYAMYRPVYNKVHTPHALDRKIEHVNRLRAVAAAWDRAALGGGHD
jgi:hypothetical protein